MGCDGGTIQTRSELVKLAKKPQKKDARMDRDQRWFFCALSRDRLAPPVVADDGGRLYNKESVLRLLLDRRSFGESADTVAHIESMKDVVELKLAENPAFAAGPSSSGPAITLTTKNDDVLVPRFICPVSMREMSGSARFSYLATCGHVFSEQALRELSTKACVECGVVFADDDVVPINTEREDEAERLAQRMVRRKAKRVEEEAERRVRKKADKAARSAKNRGAGAGGAEAGGEAPVDSGVGTSGGSGEEASDEEKRRKDRAEKKRKRDEAAEDVGPGLTYAPPRTVSNINLKLPNLDSLNNLGHRLEFTGSEAIRSIYAKKDGDDQLSSFYRGTFTR